MENVVKAKMFEPYARVCGVGDDAVQFELRFDINGNRRKKPQVVWVRLDPITKWAEQRCGCRIAWRVTPDTLEKAGLGRDSLHKVVCLCRGNFLE